MSRNASQRKSKFYIKGEDKNKAFLALKELLKKRKRLDWIDYEAALKCETFEEIIVEFGWEAETDENGNITDLFFSWEKIGDELIFFNKIAPYVKPKSYIEMMLEGGKLWRWVFDGKKCKEIFPKIIWG